MWRGCILYTAGLISITTITLMWLVVQRNSYLPLSLRNRYYEPPVTSTLSSYVHPVSGNTPSNKVYNTSVLWRNASETELLGNFSPKTNLSTSARILSTAYVQRLKGAVKFPRIMIVGFGKAGTKTLYEYLKRHPELAGPAAEMRFFSLHYTRGLQSYLSAMPYPPGNGFVIEKSPDYILMPEVPNRIIASAKSLGLQVSELKFVVMLRNPIDRAMSEYLEWNVQRKINQKPILPPFERVLTKSTGETDFSIRFINTSCYAYHIQRWLKHFNREQVCFVDGDLFIQQPYTVIHKLERCLNLTQYFTEANFILDKARGFYCYINGVSSKPLCMGRNKGRPHPTIQSHVYQNLAEHFNKWDKELASVTGCQWSWFDTYLNLI